VDHKSEIFRLKKWDSTDELGKEFTFKPCLKGLFDKKSCNPLIIEVTASFKRTGKVKLIF